MTSIDFYQPAYSPNGEFLKKVCPFFYHFWCDSLWHNAVPKDTAGLSYLDIGCADGLYLLRFMQRGGKSACGVDPKIKASGFEYLKELYNPIQYIGIEGCVNKEGNIIPDVEPANIVNCMNMIEYTDDPYKCLETLLNKTIDRLIVTVDMGPKTGYSNKLNQWLFNKNEFVSKIPYPFIVWEENDLTYPQIACVVVNKTNAIQPMPPGAIHCSTDITETQKYYLESIEVGNK